MLPDRDRGLSPAELVNGLHRDYVQQHCVCPSLRECIWFPKVKALREAESDEVEIDLKDELQKLFAQPTSIPLPLAPFCSIGLPSPASTAQSEQDWNAIWALGRQSPSFA